MRFRSFVGDLSRVNQWQIYCFFVETVHSWRPKRCVVDLQMLGHKSWNLRCTWTDFQRFDVIAGLWASRRVWQWHVQAEGKLTMNVLWHALGSA